MRPALSFLVGLVALLGACFAPHATAWTTSVSLPTSTRTRHAISPLRRATITAATAAPAQPVIQKERVLKRAPNSKLMLFDDPVNTRSYVARMLATICQLHDKDAFRVMNTAHQSGSCAVGTWPGERCELYANQMRDAGLIVEVEPIDVVS
mmetsp:Transcript_50075/g.141459  ORF Transcript_50075/g.141459 Transcript_50075/m.141459 type:complete len:151 (-) Transcript_50075:463-915(-)